MQKINDIDRQLTERMITTLKEVEKLLVHLYVEDETLLATAAEYAEFDIEKFEKLIEDLPE